MTNFALVQLLQSLVVVYWVILVVALTHARLHLPQSKCEILWDLLLPVIALVYAVVLKIIFST